MNPFEQKLSRLKDDLTTQGERVVGLTRRAVECYFDLDQNAAATVIEDDVVIDRVDVEIERAAIPILTLGETEEHKIRSVLMVIKTNNQFERIADCAVNIAQVVKKYPDMTETPPRIFRVMANSVIGMLRDANQALSTLDTNLAQRVLTYDDTIDQFKQQISIDAEQKVASGEYSVNFAFRLRTVVKSLERIADHCTNICEQIIYLETGNIVRHLPEGWSQPLPPTG